MVSPKSFAVMTSTSARGRLMIKDITNDLCDHEHIVRFAQQICGGTPSMVPVRPMNGASPQNCHENVAAAVAKYGGKRVTGWFIFLTGGCILEALCHSVWENRKKQLIDVTPIRWLPSMHTTSEVPSRICFLPDDTLQIDQFVPHKFYPTIDHPIVHDAIRKLRRNDLLLHALPGQPGFEEFLAANNRVRSALQEFLDDLEDDQSNGRTI